MFFVFYVGQSTSSDARLAAETDNADAAVSADAESSTGVQLDAYLPASKEFVNPRGIRFTTAASQGMEGWLASVSISGYTQAT